MEKRRFLIILTLIGILFIIIISVSIKYSKAELVNSEIYLKAQISQIAKNCIEEKKCNKASITFKELEEKGYVKEELKKLMNKYINAYVSYPDYETILVN